MILAIDQGTTGTTALLVEPNLQVRSRVNIEFEQIYPRPGWVEHDPEDIWDSVRAAVGRAIKGAGWSTKDAKDIIQGIGITNQRETVVLWDRQTGEPVHNAIVWQCRRTADFCGQLRDAGHEEEIRRTTGLVIDPYFSGSKIRWLLENVEGARGRAERGELAVGTIDSYLIWRLTGQHVIEISNASRTQLLDLQTRQWSPKMLELFEVPEAILPEVVDSSAEYGQTKGLDFLPDGIPVCGAAGDQQAALFGQGCWQTASAKCTYGTGSFTLINTGAEPVVSQARLLTTIGWTRNGQTTYALEGSVFICGAAVQWLRDGLEMIESAPEIEALAAQVEDSGGVVVIPAFVGLGAPHWDSEARGMICGLTRGTTRAHIARATLEAMGFQNQEIFEAMESDLGREVRECRVDGGAAANDMLMQFQADLLGQPLIRPRNLETTAMGAAMLAGLAVGVWKDLDELRSALEIDQTFEPQMDEETRAARMQEWRASIKRAMLRP